MGNEAMIAQKVKKRAKTRVSANSGDKWVNGSHKPTKYAVDSAKMLADKMLANVEKGVVPFVRCAKCNCSVDFVSCVHEPVTDTQYVFTLRCSCRSCGHPVGIQSFIHFSRGKALKVLVGYYNAKINR